MKAGDHGAYVTPSVLDRLIDSDPRSSRDLPSTRAETIRDLKQAVRRDLDSLLNSRNVFSDLSGDFIEARQSVLTYGLPELGTLSLADVRGQNRLRQTVESIIRTFEPRLSGIAATVTPPSATDHTVRVRIDGRLMVDPVPEPVSFDILMPVNSGKYEVRDRG